MGKDRKDQDLISQTEQLETALNVQSALDLQPQQVEEDISEEESKRRADRIFRMLRGDMGHTWPIGTFQKKEPIEGEFRVIEE